MGGVKMSGQAGARDGEGAEVMQRGECVLLIFNVKFWRGTPHSGCFCKRVWICLIAKELTLFATTKSLQEYQTTCFMPGLAGGISAVCSR